MSESENIASVVDAFKGLGEPLFNTHWADGQPDYVSDYQLTAKHIPALIGLATSMVEYDSSDTACYAQIHAWRSLAQLKAAEAVRPLLDHQQVLDDQMDDWYLEEFHVVFGMIGPPAIDDLTSYLKDTSRTQFPRQKAASSLSEIAKRFPESRDKVIGVLVDEINRHDKTQPELNGYVIWNLMNLKAVEAAESIERAFAANTVDPMMVGHWGDVRKDLGIEGLGLAPDRSSGWKTMAERMGMPHASSNPKIIDTQSVAATEQRQREQSQRKLKQSKERARTKRKEQKKSRKRNRKTR